MNNIEETVRRIIYDALDLGTYFDTDKEDVKEMEKMLTEEIENLDHFGVLWNYLNDKTNNMNINDEIFNNYFN